MKQVFKCYACDRKFVAESPKCECGVDGTDPRHKHLIEPCKIIHFEAPDPLVRGIGCGETACGIKITQGRLVHRSGEPTAVTCPACQESSVIKTFETARARESGDFIIETSLVK